MNERMCIHCGKTLDEGCSCAFKAPQKLDMKVEFCQQSTGTTIAEMKQTIAEYFVNDARQCTFKITVYLLPGHAAKQAASLQ